MALTQAVRFRWLESQLTITECSQFMNKLLDQNRDMIMKALFNQILKETNEQQNNASQINNIISQIIQSRKKKPKPIKTQNIKFDQLPKRLIGVIASFMDEFDYFDFSFTNRFIYLGCNSPNMLHALDLSEIENYSTINLKLFKSLNHLGLTLPQCEELIPPINDLSHMNQLKSIIIDGKEKTDTSNCINNDNITQLYCNDFGNTFRFFPTDKFMKLLAKFPNVKYLSLFRAYVDIDVNSIKDLYPKLKGLEINGVIEDTKRGLIQTFGNNLDYLSFNDYDIDIDLNLENINFSLLEQLVLITPTSKSLNDIFKTAENVKKIAIGADWKSEDKQLMTLKEMKDITSHFIIICKSLEFIQYRNDGGVFFVSILDGIEKGLFETKHLKRNKLKIHVIVDDNNKFKPTDFILNIGKIIILLNNSQINDFMFIWELRDLNNKMNENILLGKLKTQCPSSSTNIVIGLFDNCIVITNNACKINGFNETWKLDDSFL